MNDPRDPQPPPAEESRTGPPAGERLVGGRYRLGPVIGRGGMATIHRAVDIRLDRAVAVKLLRPEVSRDPDLAQRFRREALAATVLRHPNIVACLDTGSDGDQPYLVMELIEGEDLAARLRRGGRLAPWTVARIGLDVARGLGVAHVRGIVHRDVKPGNILLAVDGRAMVTDFGIARLAVDAEAAVAGTTLGSVHYFSPEQARGVTTTPASDVYGLGLVVYEALTGQRAWSGDTTDAIALARVGAVPPSPRARVPEIPAALEAIVLRALAPSAGDRYPNGMSMALALEPIVAAGDPATRTAVVAVPSPLFMPAVPALAGTLTATAMEAAAPIASPSGPHPVSPRPGSGDAPWPSTPTARRASFGAGRVLAVVGAVALVVGGILLAVSPDADGSAGATDAPAGSAEAVAPAPDPTPTPDPTVEPTPTPEPEPTPEPTPEPEDVPPGTTADLCESFFGLPCGLGAGRYGPSRFSPGFSVELGDGWSNALHEVSLVSLVRDEGGMTFASSIAEVHPNGGTETPRARARDLIEAFIATDGVSATRPADLRLDGRKGLSVDLTPIDGARIELFATATNTYFLEPDRTTRVVAIDVRGAAVLLAIEPAEGYDLRDILDTADVAAGTIDWR